MTRKRLLIVTGAAICVLLILGLLAIMFPPTGMFVGSVNGREVMGESTRRGPVRFLADGTTATIELGKQKARLTADEIELPQGRTARIPATCKKIAMFETRDGFRILFDGVEHK